MSASPPLTVGRAARVLGVRYSTLLDVIEKRSAPFPVQGADRSARISPEHLDLEHLHQRPWAPVWVARALKVAIAEPHRPKVPRRRNPPDHLRGAIHQLEGGLRLAVEAGSPTAPTWAIALRYLRDEQPELLTISDAARILNVSRATLISVIRDGTVPFPVQRAGRSYAVPAGFLDLREIPRSDDSSWVLRWALIAGDRTPPEGLVRAFSGRTAAGYLWTAIRRAEGGIRLVEEGGPSDLAEGWQAALRFLRELWRLTGQPSSAAGNLLMPIAQPLLASGSLRLTRDRETRGDDWVTKTDLVRYLRCPYSFWLLDQGQISFEDTVDDFAASLLRAGNTFEQLVRTIARPNAVEPAGVSSSELGLVRPPFENSELKIRGAPDAVDERGGELVPVEIKSHKDVRRTDELELAFYWLLLEPYRTSHDGDPRGFLILRRDNAPVQLEIPITSHRLEQVQQILEGVRRAREHGVEPRICGCYFCSRLRREQILELTWARQDLTLITGIGRSYAEALESDGITDFNMLGRTPTTTVLEALRRARRFVSTDEVERWKRHAEAWAEQRPIYFGDEPCPEGDSFIALDLEYDPGGFVWLIGLTVIDGSVREDHALWSETRRDQVRSLHGLMAVLGSHPELPILTWAGTSADLPHLRRLAGILGKAALGEELTSRHRDLYQYALRSLRLPIPNLDLKNVADYYGIPKVSQIQSGVQAAALREHYVASSDRRHRAALRAELIDYNRDDLDALIGAAHAFRKLAAGTDTSPTLDRRGADPAPLSVKGA